MCVCVCCIFPIVRLPLFGFWCFAGGGGGFPVFFSYCLLVGFVWLIVAVLFLLVVGRCLCFPLFFFDISVRIPRCTRERVEERGSRGVGILFIPSTSLLRRSSPSSSTPVTWASSAGDLPQRAPPRQPPPPLSPQGALPAPPSAPGFAPSASPSQPPPGTGVLPRRQQPPACPHQRRLRRRRQQTQQLRALRPGGQRHAGAGGGRAGRQPAARRVVAQPRQGSAEGTVHHEDQLTTAGHQLHRLPRHLDDHRRSAAIAPLLLLCLHRPLPRRRRRRRCRPNLLHTRRDGAVPRRVQTSLSLASRRRPQSLLIPILLLLFLRRGGGGGGRGGQGNVVVVAASALRGLCVGRRFAVLRRRLVRRSGSGSGGGGGGCLKRGPPRHGGERRRLRRGLPRRGGGGAGRPRRRSTPAHLRVREPSEVLSYVRAVLPPQQLKLLFVQRILLRRRRRSLTRASLVLLRKRPLLLPQRRAPRARVGTPARGTEVHAGDGPAVAAVRRDGAAARRQRNLGEGGRGVDAEDSVPGRAPATGTVDVEPTCDTHPSPRAHNVITRRRNLRLFPPPSLLTRACARFPTPSLPSRPSNVPFLFFSPSPQLRPMKYRYCSF
eukprot:Rhum_TRINITY_DN11386_c0_g2::Rhum_TRINITY_DN11386_c0_g2_i1::g.44292::m.44292